VENLARRESLHLFECPPSLYATTVLLDSVAVNKPMSTRSATKVICAFPFLMRSLSFVGNVNRLRISPQSFFGGDSASGSLVGDARLLPN